jgi:hypothetical protein
VAESGASEGITRSRRSAPGRAGTGARVVSLIDDLERVITTGQDGREYLAPEREPGLITPGSAGSSRASTAGERDGRSTGTEWASVAHPRSSLWLLVCSSVERFRLSRTVESGKPTVLKAGATPPLWVSP